MKRLIAIAILIASVILSRPERGEGTAKDPDPETSGSLAVEAGPERSLRAVRDDTRTMVRAVDAKNVERTVRTLVSFGTRSTLSVQDDALRGIGAARDWIKSELDKIAATSGGRMTVELQSFTQEPGKFRASPSRPSSPTSSPRCAERSAGERAALDRR